MSITESVINEENIKEIKVETEKSSQLQFEILKTLFQLVNKPSRKNLNRDIDILNNISD